ncbi:MAG: D-arabinono-1,4-lactone oxidase [Planctomycetota bacterium]
MSPEPPTIVNFGRNVAFQPQVMAAPRSEDEVLQILKQHAGRHIRGMGRLHSWSEAPRGDDVLLDLRHLNGVQTEVRDGRVWATIGAGCQIKRVLAELERQAGVTLPSVGLITEQTMAGAISTGTHGSGKSSLSHYIAEVRIATYDAVTGEPVIRTISDGSELRAARCSLGCLGVIVSVGLWARPQYRVEEHFRRHATLDEVLAAEVVLPLQQFYLMPWSWDFYGHHRREVTQPRSGLARLYRLYCFLTFDLGLHLILQVLVKWWRSRWGTHFFFRRVLPWTVIRHWKVTDKSQAMLVMKHELFRHIEIEVFVKRSQLPAAVSFVMELLRHFDGEPNALSDATQVRLQSLGMLETLVSCAGSYTHHYPICVRRVLPDDTLVSMASSDGEDYYALSFISYAQPSEREGFFRFAEHLARTTAALFQARPHWGKYCPIDSETVVALYPHLAEFRNVCSSLDPTGRFRNEWVSRVLFADGWTV